MIKHTEVMKLALEFIDNLHKPGWGNQERQQAITALREALASEALDRMAENARELGLDYEPVWGSGPTNKDYEDSMRQKRLHQLTSPTAQPSKPLTDEQYFEIGQRHWLPSIKVEKIHKEIIEAANGIKGDA